MLAARQVVTLFLIATLIPAPGLAWPAPVVRRTADGAGVDAIAQRVFLRALNSTEQSPMGGPNRPQLYLVFSVDMGVPPSDPGSKAAEAWNKDFISILDQIDEATTTAASAPESIFDQMETNAERAVRTSEAAKNLAATPDSVSIGDRSVRTALDDTLTDAGITGGTFWPNADGSVTYWDELPDGDLKVTGREEDGRIILTKEFTPIDNHGRPIGDPTLIQGTGAPELRETQTGGVQTSATQTTAANNTVAGNTAAPAPTGVVTTPTMASGPPTYNDALRIELEAKLTGITRDDTPTAALLGLILTRDTYVAQLNNTQAGIQELLLNPAKLDALVLELRKGAGPVHDAYSNMVAAEKAVGDIEVRNRVDLKAQHAATMREADRLQAAGDVAGADKLRQSATETSYGLFLYRQQIFYQALDQNPLLGLGSRSWVPLVADDFLFRTLRTTLTTDRPNSEFVDLVRPYLVKASTEAGKEVTRVIQITKAADFTEFGGPKYDRTRETIGMQGDTLGSSLPRTLVIGAAGWYEQIEGASKVSTEIANFGLNVVAGTAWVIPVVGPAISAGATAIQVVRDGKDLVIAVLDANDARNLSTVTGYTRVLTAEEKVAVQKGQFAVTVAGAVLEGVQAVKVTKGPVRPGAGTVATDSAGAAVNTTADATGGAVHTAPAPSPTALDKAPRVPEVIGPDGKVIGAPTRRNPQSDIYINARDEVGEMNQIFDEQLKRAKDAGVPDAKIKELTAKGPPYDKYSVNSLYLATLDAEGKRLLSRREYTRLKEISVRHAKNSLTEADYQWLRDRLAADPNYLDNLADRGRMIVGDGFDPSLNAGQQGALLSDPRVRQMVDDAKAAGPRTGAVPNDPTAPIPQTATGGQPTAAAGIAVDEAAGTVIGPARGQPPARPRPDPGTTTRDAGMTSLDPNKTTIDPNQTVVTDPNQAPLTPPSNPAPRGNPNTTRLDPGITTLDPNKTIIDPNQTIITAPSRTPLAAPSGTTPAVAPRPVDPNAGARAVEQLMQYLPKVIQAGMPPQQAAAEFRATAEKLGADPKRVMKTVMSRLSSPRPVAMADMGNAETAATRRDVHVSMEALGVSSGVAFTMRATNSGTMPIQVHGEGIVVEAVSGPPVGTAPGLVREGASQSQSANRAGAVIAPPVVTEQVEAFCLERVRPVALAGTPYRVAPPALQAQHRGLVNVLHAAKRVMDSGGLRPDSEITSYFNFVRQWSIWSRQENFDQGRFTEEFVNQTKKNVEGQGVKWTDVMRDTVRKAAPGRWRDIVAVLDAAKQMTPRASVAPASPVPVVAGLAIVDEFDLTTTMPRQLRQVAVVRRVSPAPPRLRSVVI